jgi:hypothetical protein
MEINAKERLVLYVALTIILIATIYPPILVTASYQSYSGVPSFQRVVRYEFLFTNTVKEIHYSRLFFQYMVIIVITFCIIAMPFFISKVPMNHSWQQIAKYTLENKCLRDEVNALHQENEKSKSQQLQLEKSLKQQRGELASTKEALNKQIAQSKHEKELLVKQDAIHEELNVQMAKLIANNEKLPHEIRSSHPIEELKSSKAKKSKRSSIINPLNEKKLKELADILKRLS